MDYLIPALVCLVVAWCSYRLGQMAAINTLARESAELVAIGYKHQYNIGFMDGRSYELKRKLKGEGDQ